MLRVLLSVFLLLLVSMQTPSLNAQERRGGKRSPLHIARLLCEGFGNPVGLDITNPRLTWQMESKQRGQHQTAYQIVVASTPELLKMHQGDRWNTGKVDGDNSVQVEYRGSPLESGRSYYWAVRVWDREGRVSEWSPNAEWTMALLKRTDWKGKWIGLDEIDQTYHLTDAQWIWFPEGQPEKAAPVGTRYFRRRVDLPQGSSVKDARLYVTGDNECSVYVNGSKVCDTKNFRLVTEIGLSSILQRGANSIAAAVSNKGDSPTPAGFIGLLQVRLSDGTALAIPTGGEWKSFDREMAEWQTTGFDDKAWPAAKVLGAAGMQPWGELYGVENRHLSARWLRKEFAVEKGLKRALVSMSGLGLSELYVNGKKIGDRVLSPALSEYPKTVYYVTDDITRSLTPGTNALGVVLGNGRFFAPRVHEPVLTRTYGYPKLLLQLRLEYVDGSVREIVSDESWKMTTEGPIRANNEYDGEEYDARMELGDWAASGYNDASWKSPQVVDPPGGELRAEAIKPIRVTGTLKPVSCTETRGGTYIFDMGQNMVGWCRLTVKGPRGAQVSMRHAETLKPDGELYLDNIRSAKVTDIYTLKGGGTEVYEPRFTYHGFRFVELGGFPGKPDLSTLEGCVVNDDVKTAGEFSCSHPVINHVYRNIVWGVRGNYRSLPTDCPQRDERQGWLGDRSAESRGETYLFDVAALYAKWLQDMGDAQMDNGSVSDVCPSYWPLYNDNVTWPSSTVIIPGSLFDQYADEEIIRHHYPSMVKWIDHMSTFIVDGIIAKDTYGDWCVPPEDPRMILSNDPLRKTAPGILATTYFYYDLSLMSRYAALLGKPDDQRRFEDLAHGLKTGLNEKFFNNEHGYYDNGSQTSCVLPLAFGMVPSDQRGRVFARLVEKISDESRGHVGTGLVGGQWLNRVLSENGRPDLVYTIATNTTYPSWGYMIQKGATTIWELWNGDTADPGMNSGNHVMLVGDLVIWLYENLAGIKPDPAQPGFKHIIMRPTPVGDLQFVKATHRSPYGLIASGWKISGQGFDWDVTIPVNTTATISVPARDIETITESGKPARSVSGVTFLRMEESRALFDIGPGVYRFHSDLSTVDRIN